MQSVRGSPRTSAGDLKYSTRVTAAAIVLFMSHNTDVADTGDRFVIAQSWYVRLFL